MFSGLSKLLDKAFVLGFFLPALIAIFGFAFANRDIDFFNHWLSAAISGNKDFGNLATFLGAVWVFAVSLMALNNSTYRLLEGYIWPIKRKSAQRNQQRLRKVQRGLIRQYDTEYETAKSEWARIVAKAPESEAAIEAERKQSQCYQKFLKERESSALRYPSDRDDVLSTRFGNVLRSFELYSTDVYSAETIHIWPRLLAVIPHDYQSLMADARSTVDFLVSLVALASFTSIFTVGRALWLFALGSLISNPVIVQLLVSALVAGLVAIGCYGMAISAAGRWGNYVKGAFDLYLPALAKALGYKLPRTPDEQRDFWDQWSSQFRFHDRVDATGWEPVPTTTEREPKKIDRDDAEETENEGESEEEATDDAD